MAKLVLAGKANCPYYAKAELLADYLQANLPDFRVHKITQHPDKWEWLHDICEMNGWDHRQSPIIWRELLDRGGKGLLLGGIDDFLEYAEHYYGITSMMLSEEMLGIAEENLQTHIEIEKEEEEIRCHIKPLQIWITSASVPICYQLIPLLANGEVFGMTTEISIHLLDTDKFKEVLCGIVMEAEDMAFPLLRSISEHTELDEAFIQADIIIVLDDVLLNREVQSLENDIREVSEICQVYAPLIERNAKSGVRVISSGKTFVNLKAMMIMTYGPSIKPENVIAVATSWESAAKAMLAKKLNMNAAGVKDVIVWGNITGCNYIDLSHAKLYGYDCAVWSPANFPHPLLNRIYDSEWIHSEFLSAQSSLSSRICHSMGMLPAHAVATVLKYWYLGSPPGEIVSVGILTKGQFHIPEGIVFSMPVRFQNGKWEVMTELEINEMTQEVLGRLAHELIQEKLIALKEIKEIHPYGADKITSENMSRMPNAICSFQMDPDLQEAFNDVQNSVYRTALKLRSIQSRCQLDLIDVSLIQHMLSSEKSQEEKQISLKVQQISSMLTELFQRARLEKPGQVDPRAAEFTLSLLAAMYDRSGTGYIKTRPAAAALIALSGDTLLAKYRAFFQFYAVPDEKVTSITRSALRSLLTDLNQIPAIVGESCTLSCVEIATRSCFHGVLNSAIVEEKFLSWLGSEPAVLLWLPTCYRLSVTEMVSHQARCRVCKVFPITGLRYRCLKCFNFDLCQVCFFTGRLSKPHKRSHPVVEHCVQVFSFPVCQGSPCALQQSLPEAEMMSAKANAKHFLCTVKNNLFQERCRRKEAQRRRGLEIVKERHFPIHKKTFPCAELSASPPPSPENLSFPVNRPVLDSPKFVSENRTVMQRSENISKTPEQGKKKAQGKNVESENIVKLKSDTLPRLMTNSLTSMTSEAFAIASLEADVLKMHESIKSIHNESRYMKKQFNKWMDKMQFLYNCQEGKSCKIEANLQSLRASHENLQMKLQQMKQEVKTMLQSSEHPLIQHQNMMPRNPHVLMERRMQGELKPAQIRPTSEMCADWKSLNPHNSTKRMQLLKSLKVPTAVDFMFSEDQLESVSLESNRPFMGQNKNTKETQLYLSELEENSLGGIMRNTVLTPTAVQIPPDEKEVSEEIELQQLVMKLKDALSLQAQPAQQSALQLEFFTTAEHVCRSFSDLVNQVTSSACK